MRLEFNELSVRSNGVGYGAFSGEAEFDDYGDAVVIEIEATLSGGKNLKLDRAELVRERTGLRRGHGSCYLESENVEVREHLKKWVLFSAFSESLLIQYKDAIAKYLLDRWSPQRGVA